MKRLLPFLIIFIAVLTSCRQQKELIYFNGLQTADLKNATAIDLKEYKIKVSDILYIKVLTSDEKINALFSSASGSSGGMNYQYFSEEAMYFSGFSVRPDGTVDIPSIGMVPVVGKNIEEAKQLIVEKSKEQLKEPTVLVKLANFKVTLLGEVMRPGTYNYFNNQTTILEAIGKAGDLTDYGDRKQVLIIRPTVDGSCSYRINLQDPNLISAPEYYIQPNDVVYVPPLKAKGLRMIASDYGVLFSVISSTIATLSIVVTLILNLKQ